MTTRTKREKERLVLVAVGLANYLLADVRRRCPWLDDRQFRIAMLDLMSRGVLVRVGSGATATVRRDLGKWVAK